MTVFFQILPSSLFITHPAFHHRDQETGSAVEHTAKRRPHLWFSWRWLRILLSCKMRRRVIWQKCANVTEDCTATERSSCILRNGITRRNTSTFTNPICSLQTAAHPPAGLVGGFWRFMQFGECSAWPLFRSLQILLNELHLPVQCCHLALGLQKFINDVWIGQQ